MTQAPASPPGTAPHPLAPPAVMDAASPEITLQPPEEPGCILRLPADLQEQVLEAAMKDPEAFKKLLFTCRAWAASVPSLPCHLSIREDACIAGQELAMGMSQIKVASLKLLRRSVRGLLPSTTPSAAAVAEAEGTHHGAPWTASLRSLDLSDVDFQCTDVVVRDLPRLEELTCTFKLEYDAIPGWMDGGFPPQLERLRLHNLARLYWEIPGRPIPDFHYPRTLRSLHLTDIGDKFFQCLGDLPCLKSLTIVHCGIKELPVTIRNLKQLQHLTIETCYYFRTLPNEVSDLVSLTTLRILDGWMIRFPNLGTNLQSSLRVLQLTDTHSGNRERVVPPLESFPPDLAHCCQLRNLRLQSSGINTVPALPASLQVLRLDLPNVTELPDVSSMAHLKKLFFSCDNLEGLPPSLATSTSLEVLHIDFQVLSAASARIICPPNLRDLRIVGAVAYNRGTGKWEPSSAHGHIEVVPSPSLKKVYLTSCFQSLTEGAGCVPLSPLPSLEELALFCEGSCAASSQETPALRTTPVLPSLTKLSLWCQEGTCWGAGLESLVGLTSLRLLQVEPWHWHAKGDGRPCTSGACPPEACLKDDATIPFLEGPHSGRRLIVYHEAPSFPWSAPSLSSIQRLFVSGPDREPLPSSLSNLSIINNLVLHDLSIRSFPDCLAGLRDLASLRVSGCSSLTSLPLPPTWTRLESLHVSGCNQLRVLNLSPTWKRLESLHISDCSELQSPGESLTELVALKALVLGCTLMHPEPPAISALHQLTSFSVPPHCLDYGHHGLEDQPTTLPSTLWKLPHLRVIKATASCVCEVPVELPPLPSLESLELGEFLCLPSLRSLEGLGIRQKRQVAAAAEELRGRTELVTEWLPTSMDCLTQLRKLSLRWNSSHVLPFSFAELTKLTHLKFIGCSHFEALPLELASLPCLAKLKLWECGRLKEIPGASTGYGALKKIVIMGCPRLGVELSTFLGRLNEVEIVRIQRDI